MKKLTFAIAFTLAAITGAAQTTFNNLKVATNLTVGNAVIFSTNQPLANATTPGVVVASSATNSTSTNTVATSAAVKAANDAAMAASTTAANAIASTNGLGFNTIHRASSTVAPLTLYDDGRAGTNNGFEIRNYYITGGTNLGFAGPTFRPTTSGKSGYIDTMPNGVSAAGSWNDICGDDLLDYASTGLNYLHISTVGPAGGSLSYISTKFFAGGGRSAQPLVMQDGGGDFYVRSLTGTAINRWVADATHFGFSYDNTDAINLFYNVRPTTNVVFGVSGSSGSLLISGTKENGSTAIPVIAFGSSIAMTTDGSTYPVVLSNNAVTINAPTTITNLIIGKNSGSNGPVLISNGYSAVDPSLPTVPILMIRPFVSGTSMNIDLAPNFGGNGSTNKGTSFFDFCNWDPIGQLAGLTNLTWLHVGAESDGSYTIAGNAGVGNQFGNLNIQNKNGGANVGIGRYGTPSGSGIIADEKLMVQPTAGVHFGIHNTGSSVLVNARADDLSTYIGIVYRALTHFFSFDGNGTQRTFFQVRPGTGINDSFDSTGTAGRVQFYDDSGTSIDGRIQGSRIGISTTGTFTQRSALQLKPAAGYNLGLDQSGTAFRGSFYDESGVDVAAQWRAASVAWTSDGGSTFGVIFSNNVANITAAVITNLTVTATETVATLNASTANVGGANTSSGFGTQLRVATTSGNNGADFIAYGGTPAIYMLAANGTSTSPTALTSNKTPHFWFGGYDGSAMQIGGGVTGTPTSTWSGSNRGMNLDFSTTADTTTSLVTPFRVAGSGNVQALTGNLTIDAAGKGLVVKAGSNCRLGTTGAMTAGSVTVNNNTVTANTVFFLSINTVGGTVGIPAYVSSRVNGTSFTVTASATDSSNLNYFMVESQ